MRPVAADPQLAAGTPDLAAEQIVGPFGHHARPVAAWRARPHRVRHGAQRGLDVGRIDAGRLDLNEHLIGTRMGRLPLLDPKIEFFDVGTFLIDA